ncbi:MAG: V-type ATP synthase subunit F [Candidatus Aenigmarchaeota archaeon]|nr:V-type ATP synthase subunit F [Candidatus Aenigmarchaeota archaeon]
MPDIVVLGKPDFIIGFELAGIKDTIVADNNDMKTRLSEALKNKDIGILVMHKTDVEALPQRLQDNFDSSVRPVTVMVSEETTSDDRLRKQIKKAIGVDVWNKE